MTSSAWQQTAWGNCLFTFMYCCQSLVDGAFRSTFSSTVQYLGNLSIGPHFGEYCQVSPTHFVVVAMTLRHHVVLQRNALVRAYEGPSEGVSHGLLYSNAL